MRLSRPFLLAVLTLLTTSAAHADYDANIRTLLKMDDIKSAAVVPELEAIMQIVPGDIRKYAAAQALYLMATDTATASMKKHMALSHYDLDQSIRYAFHWEMDPAKRDAFIRNHHMQSVSDEVGLQLEASRNGDALIFVLSVKNTSNRLLRLYKPHVYLGRSLLLLSSTGEVMKGDMTVEYKLGPRDPEEEYPQLYQGETMTITIKGKLAKKPKHQGAKLRDTLWLDCLDYSHQLSKADSFMVYGLYSSPELPNPPFKNIWSGRVLSEPVKITIAE